MVKAIVMMFEVHQPYRLERRFELMLQELVSKKGRILPKHLFEAYFDEGLNRFVVERVAKRCYLPANNIILEQIDEHRYDTRKYKVAYSLSGVFIEQCEKWIPEVLESFRQLADTGMVEFLDQTYYHSLSSMFSEGEFVDQIKEHKELMKNLLGVEPKAVENTEFIYNNRIALILNNLGYKVVFTEGVERVLGWRSPNYLYKAKGSDIRVLMRNYQLSDDIGFRFGSRWWEEYPLTADKYASWLAATPGQVINICIDYETFGEHFPAETGIFEFLRWLPGEVLKWEDMEFMTPSEVADRFSPVDEVDVPEHMTISWADLEKDLSAWLMNYMQKDLFEKITKLEKPLKILGDKDLLKLWRLLMISDHFYYMSTKGGGPGEVHAYFSPYGSAIEAYGIFNRILSHFESTVMRRFEPKKQRLKLMWAREIPPEKAFHFYLSWNEPLGWAASNMDQFLWCVEHAPIECIEFHVSENHFVSWIKDVVGDKVLAVRLRKIRKVKGEKLRKMLVEMLKNRREEIYSG